MYLKKRLEDFGLEAMPASTVQAAPVTSLLARLTTLDIESIPTRSVNRYKRQKLRETKQPGLRVAKACLEIGENAFFLAGVLLSVATVLRMGFLKMSDLPVFTTETFWLAGLTVGAFMVGRLMYYGVERLSNRIAGPPKYAAAWKRSPYSEYAAWRAGEHVPPDIQVRAGLVKRALPEASLSVDWFYEDPFLVVEHNGEELFIGVWDEAGFA